MDTVLKNFLILTIASSCTVCQELPVNYNARSVARAGAGVCPDTQGIVEGVRRDIDSLIDDTLLPALVGGPTPENRPCGCGGPGWRRAAYLNMSYPTQACPPSWELIATPRRSCSRPSNATSRSCYSAMFPTQDCQYSQVCGRIIGYQVGQPQAFFLSPNNSDSYYIDGVSLTYENPRQHIWTFANALNEYPHVYHSKCPCTNVTEQRTIPIPSFVGNDYFCETGVPPGQYFNSSVFYADDPLWDGQGCGPTSTCCTFNNPPWFCKQLPQSTNADLEVRLCSHDGAFFENTPVELIEIYVH